MATKLKILLELAALNKDNLPNKKILSIGSNIIGTDQIPNSLAKKLNLDEKKINSTIKEIKNAKIKNDLKSYHSINKQFFNYVIKQIGYESYEDADVNDFADYYLNLNNDSLPDELIKKKYGIIIESGTSNYCSNIFNSYKNILNLSSLGTHILSSSETISFNRYPLSPSPNFIIDYFVKNGCEVKKSELIKSGSDIQNIKTIGKRIENAVTNYFLKENIIHKKHIIDKNYIQDNPHSPT